MAETKSNKLLGETVKIPHLLVPSMRIRIKAIKKDQAISRSVRVIGPLFVFQEFLSHKKHRNAGRGQKYAGGYPRSARAEKRSVVAWIRQSRNARTRMHVDVVVAFQILHCLEDVRKIGGTKGQGAGESLQVQRH